MLAIARTLVASALIYRNNLLGCVFQLAPCLEDSPQSV
jgi:hypothetical protein